MRINPLTLKLVLFMSFIGAIAYSSITDFNDTSKSYDELLTLQLEKVELYKRDSESGELVFMMESVEKRFLSMLSDCLNNSKRDHAFRNGNIHERFIIKFLNEKSIHEIQMILYESGNSSLGGYYKVTDILSGDSKHVGSFGLLSTCLMKQLRSMGSPISLSESI